MQIINKIANCYIGGFYDANFNDNIFISRSIAQSSSVELGYMIVFNLRLLMYF